MRQNVLALIVGGSILCGSLGVAQERDISGDLPWDNFEANPVLQLRLDEMYPDGTPVAVLNAALDSERFSMVSDDRGLSAPTEDGPRFASRGVIRLRFGCSTRVMLQWEQRGGQVFDMEGMMHEGCL